MTVYGGVAMQLHLVPHSQLLEIRRCVKMEILRRRKSKVNGKEFKEAQRTFEKMYREESGEPEPTSHLGINPDILKHHPNKKLRFFNHIIGQDWTYLFPSEKQEKVYYVYMHSAPKQGYVALPRKAGGTIKTPFYIGKGTGNRAYDLNRNQGHGAKIRELLKSGCTKDDIVTIIKDNLTESQALALESKLIYFFGTLYQKNRNGILVNLDIPPTPNFGGYVKLPNLKKQRKKERLAASDKEEGCA